MHRLALFLAALIFPVASLSASELSAGKPNILIVVGDDMGYADVRFHGANDFPTPNLDTFAADGVTVNGSNNAPLRGSKRTTLEGGIRVPYVITWPGLIMPRILEQSAIQLHLHETVLAAVGVTAKPEWKPDRVNLLPLLSGEKAGARHDAQLYNLAADIHKDQDLSAMNPDKVKELQASWKAWNQAHVAPLWGDRNEGGKKQDPAKSGKKKRKNAQ